MKEITKIEYHSDDGAVFYSKESCIAHEIGVIIDALGPLRDLKSNEFVQHPLTLVQQVRRDACLKVNLLIPHEWIEVTANDWVVDSSWVYRLVDDYDNRKLRHVWYRIMCIDKMGREWQQPYFANNTPENPIQVSLFKG